MALVSLLMAAAFHVWLLRDFHFVKVSTVTILSFIHAAIVFTYARLVCNNNLRGLPCH